MDHSIDLERIHPASTEPIQSLTDMLDQLTETRFVIRRHTIPGSLPLSLRHHSNHATDHRSVTRQNINQQLDENHRDTP
ncbi:hypothetical protein, partial [Nocardia sp. 852002-20019_SCH5090214]|uniref:hypothetical protein n=1 Tax=Nocardia sp. 852002-20019_SCH5090214 TaxID=1834087 RepID=UPI001E5A289F